MSSRDCPAQHQSVLNYMELQCLGITKITKIKGRGGSCAPVHPFCQHQSVLRRTELNCESTTMNTNTQGRAPHVGRGGPHMRT